MSYIKKNKEKMVLFIGGIFVLCFIGTYVYQQQFNAVALQESVTVYPTTLQVGDTLFFKENTPNSSLRKWEFGDGDLSLDAQGYHQYKKPGFYQVSYIANEQDIQLFSIEVKPNTTPSYGDYFTEIDAPAEAMQFENVVFRAVTDKASLFSWKFGETGTIDAKEAFAIYAYQEAGTYEVYLYTDETAYPVIHQITIHPSFKHLNEELDVEDGYKSIDHDFKEHLQQIANGAPFNQHYNYLVNTYLCQNENALVLVNTTKRNSFYYYCMGLRFDSNVSIQSVKVSFNEEANCVTKLNVVQTSN
ncbi:hypothetical protein [Myroides odoratus]|uniref:hypothetical protein n=1 Tax=Myroides odoratus TaxID=256 RepID=UPI000765888D|nr:hypothetical protein [Myroides odoratus]